MSVTKLTVSAMVVAAVVFAIETLLQTGSGASLILNLTFWLAIAEGSVALIAAAEVSRATWHHPIKERMLSAYPMILVVALLFLTFVPQMDIYPWWGDPHFWAQKWLFVVRHVAWMLAAFFLARKFAAEALKGTHAARRWGVIYLIIFVLGQTIVGLEWVMSLEKPWFSTLFGAYFMVESLQSGIVIGGLVLLSMRAPGDERWRFAQRSVGGLMFGFSIFWAYFYFSQLIVIWYGNLPEEVQYLARRIGYHTPYWALARVIFGLCWVTPFAVLLGKRAKMNPRVVSIVGIIILLGFYFEKWLMIAPAAPVNLALQIVETVLLGGLFAVIMRSGQNTLPRVERAADPTPALSPIEQR
jgi:hypothetical protein